MLRLLLYSHAFTPSIGGIETYARLLAQGLAELPDPLHRETKACRVTVVTKTPRQDHDDSQFAFTVVRRPNRLRLLRLVRDADVVHVAGPAMVPMLVAWLFQTPFVVEHDGYQSICTNGNLMKHPDKTLCPGYFTTHRYQECIKCQISETGIVSGLRRFALTPFRRWLCQHAKRNISGTNHVLKRIGLSNELITPHGVPDLAQTSVRLESHQELNPCLAYVGRMAHDKGVAILLRAAKLLVAEGRQFRLKLIGDGPEMATLQELARKLEIQDIVQWTGFLTGTALEGQLSDAKAVVMPSVWEEAAPLVVLEQMMAGRLLIVADLGGQAEELADAGMRFPVGNHRELAECMKRALDDPALVDQLKVKARIRALSSYRSDQMVFQHLELYKSVVSRDIRLATQ